MSADRGQAAFTLEASPEPLRVNCAGPLPDNLAEGIDVVVEGRLDAKGLLRGDKVLTRCASKYESHEAKPETKDIAGRDAKSRL